MARLNLKYASISNSFSDFHEHDIETHLVVIPAS